MTAYKYLPTGWSFSDDLSRKNQAKNSTMRLTAAWVYLDYQAPQAQTVQFSCQKKEEADSARLQCVLDNTGFRRELWKRWRITFSSMVTVRSLTNFKKVNPKALCYLQTVFQPTCLCSHVIHEVSSIIHKKSGFSCSTSSKFLRLRFPRPNLQFVWSMS